MFARYFIPLVCLGVASQFPDTVLLLRGNMPFPSVKPPRNQIPVSYYDRGLGNLLKLTMSVSGVRLPFSFGATCHPIPWPVISSTLLLPDKHPSELLYPLVPTNRLLRLVSPAAVQSDKHSHPDHSPTR